VTTWGQRGQAAAGMRGDDIEATLRLWEAGKPGRVRAICDAAREAHDGLAGLQPRDSVAIWAWLPAEIAEQFTAAVPRRDPDYWHLAADSAAALRPYTLPSEGGGLIGRRITQIKRRGDASRRVVADRTRLPRTTWSTTGLCAR